MSSTLKLIFQNAHILFLPNLVEHSKFKNRSDACLHIHRLESMKTFDWPPLIVVRCPVGYVQ